MAELVMEPECRWIASGSWSRRALAAHRSSSRTWCPDRRGVHGVEWGVILHGLGR